MSISSTDQRGFISTSASSARRSLEQAVQQLVSCPQVSLKTRLFLIAGEAGIGKTFLLAHASTFAAAQGATVLEIPCSTHRTQPVETLLQCSTIPSRESLLSVPISSGESFHPGHDSTRLAALASVVAALEARSTVAHQVIIIDDLHLAQPDVFHLIRLTMLRSTPILVIASYDIGRRNDQDLASLIRFTEAYSQTVHAVLTQWTREELKQFLLRVLSKEPPESLVERLYQLTAGHPILVEQTLRVLIQSADLALDSSKGPPGSNTTALDDLPRNLHDLAVQQLIDVPANLRRLLDVLALCRTPVPPHLLADIVSRDPTSVHHQLSELLQRNLLSHEDGDGGFRFRHRYLQEYLLSLLSTKHRQAIHRRIGAALQRYYPNPMSGELELLAYHYVEACDLRHAHHYAYRAAVAATERLATHTAADLMMRGLDLTPAEEYDHRLQYLEFLGSLLVRLGDMLKATHTYNEMLLLAKSQQRPRMEAHSVRELARIYFETGEIDRAIAYASAAESLYSLLDDSSGQAQASLIHSQALRKLGRISTALESVRRAHRLALASGDHKAIAFAKELMGLLYTDDGHYEHAVGEFEQVLALRSAMGDVCGAAVTYNNLGLAYLEKNDFGKATSFLERALTSAREMGLSLAAVLSSINLGEIHRYKAQLSTARRYLLEGFAIADGSSREYYASYAQLALAHCDFLSGDFESALSRLSHAERGFHRGSLRADLTQLLVLKLQLARTLANAVLEEEVLVGLQRLALSTQNAGVHTLITLLTSGHVPTAPCIQSLHPDLYACAEFIRLENALTSCRPETSLDLARSIKRFAAERGRVVDYHRAAIYEARILTCLHQHHEAEVMLREVADQLAALGLRQLMVECLYYLSQTQRGYMPDAANATIVEASLIVDTIESLFTDAKLKHDYQNTTIIRLFRERACATGPGHPACVSSPFPQATLRQAISRRMGSLVRNLQAKRAVLVVEQESTRNILIEHNGDGVPRYVDFQSTSESLLMDYEDRSDSDVMKRWYRLPVLLRGKQRGVLYLEYESPTRLSRADLLTAEIVADEISTAMSGASEQNDQPVAALSRRLVLTDCLIGQSPAMDKVRKMMDSVIKADCNVLLIGESGTGKELVARSIHSGGRRKSGLFVPLDCGAIPENLVESELFGYRRGAFSGAEHDRRGLLEEADGGTLFLDEVTNTSLSFQAKLLRTLQSGEFRRLGENAVRRVDARIIAATNTDVDLAIKDGRFREDLYYRLNVVTLRLPPLRERKSDIPLLAEFFARRFCEEQDISFAGIGRGALLRLQAYSWPGNVRELEHAVQAALVVSGDGMVRRDALPEKVLGDSLDEVRDLLEVATISTTSHGVSAENCSPVMENATDSSVSPHSRIDEKSLIEDALRQANGDKSAAARILGWNRMRLYRSLRRHGIPYDSGRDRR